MRLSLGIYMENKEALQRKNKRLLPYCYPTVTHSVTLVKLDIIGFIL